MNTASMKCSVGQNWDRIPILKRRKNLTERLEKRNMLPDNCFARPSSPPRRTEIRCD